jgi:hypothetical protein
MPETGLTQCRKYTIKSVFFTDFLALYTDNSMDRDQTGKIKDIFLFAVLLAGLIFMIIYWGHGPHIV